MLRVVTGLLDARGCSEPTTAQALETLAFAVPGWRSVDDALLCNALANHSPAIRAMLAEVILTALFVKKHFV
jgi:hypothetical protein